MMTKTEEIVFVLLVALPFIGLWAFWILHELINPDPDLAEENKREAIHRFFEAEAAGLELPGKTTVSNFQKGGKVRSSILDQVTFRADLPAEKLNYLVDAELRNRGWTYWKFDHRRAIFCKGKFELHWSICCEKDGRQSDVKLEFTVGLESDTIFDTPRPRECGGT